MKIEDIKTPEELPLLNMDRNPKLRSTHTELSDAHKYA